MTFERLMIKVVILDPVANTRIDGNPAGLIYSSTAASDPSAVLMMRWGLTIGRQLKTH